MRHRVAAHEASGHQRGRLNAMRPIRFCRCPLGITVSGHQRFARLLVQVVGWVRPGGRDGPTDLRSWRPLMPQTACAAAERICLTCRRPPAAGTSGHHWLLLRGNRKTGEYAFYRAYSPSRVPLKTLVLVAGRRWTVEESFAASKELAALDEHQARTWKSWHRWSALAILTHVFLSVMTANEPPPPPGRGLFPCPATRSAISSPRSSNPPTTPPTS
jgi:hypothetical protein